MTRFTLPPFARAQAWKRLADEQEKEIPYEWQIKKALGMPVSLAISQVFCWERDPMAVRRIEERHKVGGGASSNQLEPGFVQARTRLESGFESTRFQTLIVKRIHSAFNLKPGCPSLHHYGKELLVEQLGEDFTPEMRPDAVGRGGAS